MKSLQRVPIPITRSASAASRFAAAVPVAPTAPSASGWSESSEPLPACVSPTGMPVALGERRSAAAPRRRSRRRRRRSAAAARRAISAAARASAPGAGGRRQIVHTRCSRNSAGHSNASVCTSWGSASVTAPVSAGSVSTRIASSSAGDQLLRPRDPVEVARDRLEASLTDMSASCGASICCSTGCGARVANVSPGSSSTGSRLTVASAAPVTMFVAPGPTEDVHAQRREPVALARVGGGDVHHRLLVARRVVGAGRASAGAPGPSRRRCRARRCRSSRRRSGATSPSRSTLLDGEEADERLRDREPHVSSSFELAEGRHRVGARQPRGDDRAGGVGQPTSRSGGQPCSRPWHERAAERVARAEPVEDLGRTGGTSTGSLRACARARPAGPRLTIAIRRRARAARRPRVVRIARADGDLDLVAVADGDRGGAQRLARQAAASPERPRTSAGGRGRGW